MIDKGKKVKVEYEGTLEDGTVFDSSEKHGQPLEFEIGAGQIIPGFEKAVCDLEVGKECEIDIPADEAYGQENPELVKKVPKGQLPEGAEAGATVMIKLPNGQQLPAKIIEIGDEELTLDLNHPLAGKKLHFKIKLLEVN